MNLLLARRLQAAVLFAMTSFASAFAYAGDLRLEIVSDQELDDEQAAENDDRHLPRVELCGRENCRNDNCNDRADIGDVVQHKRYDTPRDRQIKTNGKRINKDRQPSRDTSDVRMSMYFLIFLPISSPTCDIFQPSIGSSSSNRFL